MGVARQDWAQAFVLCVALPFVLERLPPYTRVQALDDPSVMHPHLPDTVPASTLVILSLFLPLLAFLACSLASGDASRSASRLEMFALGLVEANGLTVAVTNILKLLAGRPRPHFAAVCVAYVEGSNAECTGDEHAVWEARKSFPSGHSSLAFAAAIYTSAYLAGIISLAQSQHGRNPNGQGPLGWKFLVVMAPPLLAALVAVSRTRDWHHNYDDIVCGSLLGSAISALVARSRLPDVLAAEVDARESERRLYEPVAPV
jgi:diacylglycerol diphosphate phosphatase / phosphatidate phosphatase